MVDHHHHSGCGCAQEHKMSDPYGIDMFDFIDLSQVECFNEKQRGQAKQVLRPFNDKLRFL